MQTKNVAMTLLSAFGLAAQAACPTGTSFNSTLGFCADASYAYGPFTKAMTDACISGGGGSSCTATALYTVNGVSLALPRWTLSTANSLRGKKACPAGALANSSYDGLCSETVSGVTSLYANFSATLTSRCSTVGGGNACLYTRWDAALYNKAAFQQHLQTNLTSAWSRSGLPSVTVSVSTPDQGMVNATTGVASPTSLPVNPAVNQYRFGSVSKNITATLIMKLQEAGMLNIDDKLAQHLVVPGLPNGDIITIRQLLNHSAGVGDYLNDSTAFINSTSQVGHIYTDSEIVGYINALGAKFAPGSAYSYSNGGFYILSMLIEKKLGLPLNTAVQQWITTPLGLNNTFMDLSSSSSQKIANLVESSRAYAYSTTSVKGAGALVATSDDLARYVKAIYGSTFLTAASINAMQSAQVSSSYGLGTIRFSDANGIPYYGHTGTLLNYKSIIYYIPSMNASAAISTNDYPSNADWDNIRAAVYNTIAGQYTSYCASHNCSN